MRVRTAGWLLAFATALAAVPPAGAQLKYPAPEMLVPYFEVDLFDGGRTTSFAVSNDAEKPVLLEIELFTNWGIPVLTTSAVVGANAVLTVNLHDWIVAGHLLDRTLSAAELAEVQAALCGLPGPTSGLYHGAEVEPLRATGFLEIRNLDPEKEHALWGDYFVVEPGADFEQGETLVSLRDDGSCEDCCERQGIRFLECATTGVATDLMVWSDHTLAPHDGPDPLPEELFPMMLLAFDESGALVDRRSLDMLPAGRIDVCDLGIGAPFGWVELRADAPFFVTGHYTYRQTESGAIHSYCLPAEFGPEGPGIRVEKLVNGSDADIPPGPRIWVGAPVTFTFEITNVGVEALHDIVLSDDVLGEIVCPQTELAVGEGMTCTAEATAEGCAHHDMATVVGTAPDGKEVGDTDPANYFGRWKAEVSLVKRTNGEDANTAPGATIAVGAPVTWTYEVTNTGEVDLTGVTISDDQGVAVTCPKSELVVGESMTCTASGTAVAGQYANVGTVRARPPCGSAVTATDPSHYYGSRPGIEIQKLTNGEDADRAPGPRIAIGSPITWSYVVTNVGEVRLTAITVVDDRGVAVACPKTALDARESMTCTGSGTAAACQYENLGTATGTPPHGPAAVDTDPSHYFGTFEAILALEKRINGNDADQAPGVIVTTGSALAWTFVVTNAGNVPLSGVSVTDDDVAVTCPKTVLAVGEVMTCTAAGIAEPGLHRNLGRAAGKPPCGNVVRASDEAYYFGQNPAIALEKLTNGQEADVPPGPLVVVGTPVLWTYVVTNVGDVRLTQVRVSDDKGVAVTCPKTVLEPGESMTCTAAGTAVAGQYKNLATVIGHPDAGSDVTATDPSHYFGVSTPGDEGCTPGYWKNHTDSWPPTGYSPTQKVKTAFASAASYPALGDSTLLQALSFAGGPGTDGAAEILLRAAVAALLNAAHPDVAYPRLPTNVVVDVNAALDTHSRDTMLTLAAALDADNNRGCPLN